MGDPQGRSFIGSDTHIILGSNERHHQLPLDPRPHFEPKTRKLMPSAGLPALAASSGSAIESGLLNI